MSKKTKQLTKKEKRRGAKREERRFLPVASANATVVRFVAALAAMFLGAGLWGYFYAQSFADDERLRQVPAYLIASGLVLVGLAIWFGTSGDAPVRVGAPGIAVEKGELRRMPWWAVEKVAFDSAARALVVSGKDDAAVAWTFRVSLRTHPEAAYWLVKEASERIAANVELSDEDRRHLPTVAPHAGTLVDLEPLQVVGRKDALTGKTISYEPDACVCGQCERVYAKSSVPSECPCGASLAHFRPSAAASEASEPNAQVSVAGT